MYSVSKSSSSHKSKNKFNYASQPVFPIQISSQLNILSLQISESGRTGVIFIETQLGSFVLKANNSAPQDQFFNQLAIILDLNVPNLSTIGCYQKQFQTLVFLIEKYCHSDQTLYARLQPKLDFPFYQLIEYIPSISLSHVGEKKFKKNMLLEYKLYTVGICLGYDMICNNCDRYQLIWRGDGNINNILIQLDEVNKNSVQRSRNREDESVKLRNFVYIDHGGNFVNYEDSRIKQTCDKYYESVMAFHLSMIQYLRKQSESYPEEFENFCKQHTFYTQYKYCQQDIVKICEGIIYCTKKFIDAYEEKKINQLFQSLIKSTQEKESEKNYWNQYWNQQLKKIHLNFCELFYVKISAIYTTYPQLINAIYAKVKSSIQKNKRKSLKQRAKGQDNSSRQSQLNSRQKSHRSNQDQQNNKNSAEDLEEQKKQKARKWREKLQKFKLQNYK